MSSSQHQHGSIAEHVYKSAVDRPMEFGPCLVARKTSARIFRSIESYRKSTQYWYSYVMLP